MNDNRTTPLPLRATLNRGAIESYTPTTNAHCNSHTASGHRLGTNEGHAMTRTTKRMLRTIALATIATLEAYRDLRA